MSIEEFIKFMEEHNLSVDQLIFLYNQWTIYNYMGKTEIKYRLNKFGGVGGLLYETKRV